MSFSIAVTVLPNCTAESLELLIGFLKSSKLNSERSVPEMSQSARIRDELALGQLVFGHCPPAPHLSPTVDRGNSAPPEALQLPGLAGLKVVQDSLP